MEAVDETSPSLLHVIFSRNDVASLRSTDAEMSPWYYVTYDRNS
jgi:hypothetical protein